MPTLDTEAIAERVNAFERWHYRFELNGVTTPIFDQDHVNRHAQRARYFFDPLVELCGGSLSGLRVLDLGCNAGYWSLLSIHHGCDFVLGIDGRQMHIDQANLVFQVNEVDPARYRFTAGNVFHVDVAALGGFDVVLCLGLLYHVNKPVELFQRIAQVNTDIVVVDTALSAAVDSSFAVLYEDSDEPRHTVEPGFVLHPSRLAVLDLARVHGYESLVLRPAMTDYTGAEDYRLGQRRAFICTKRTALHRIEHLAEPSA